MSEGRTIEVHPVTPNRWDDLAALFGPRGAISGCWCMSYRLPAKEFSNKSNQDNRTAFKAIVDSGEPPGLLAYVNGVPAGWVSLDPRERFARLERSPKLKRVDDQPVWSIVCFVIGRRFRRRGLMTALLRAAIDYAAKRGATIVEGYPVEPTGTLKGWEGFSGIASTYKRLGFQEVLRPGGKQVVMRYNIERER